MKVKTHLDSDNPQISLKDCLGVNTLKCSSNIKNTPEKCQRPKGLMDLRCSVLLQKRIGIPLPASMFSQRLRTLRRAAMTENCKNKNKEEKERELREPASMVPEPTATGNEELGLQGWVREQTDTLGSSDVALRTQIISREYEKAERALPKMNTGDVKESQSCSPCQLPHGPRSVPVPAANHMAHNT